VKGLVALHRSPFLALFLGPLHDVRPGPLEWGRRPPLERVDPLGEAHHLIAQELVLLFALTVLRLVRPSLLGSEGHWPNIPALAHAERERSSRI
jgi:hypothetical protein